MKYFTKEWYELSQQIFIYHHIKKSDKAETFSEKYFQKLFNKKLEHISKTRKIKYDNLLNDLVNAVKNNISYYEKVLPKEIIEQIPDIRVLALGKATKQNRKLIKQFCKKNEKTVDDVAEKYNLYYNEILNKLPEKIVNKFYFYDFIVKSNTKVKDDIIISLKNDGIFDDIYNITFKNSDSSLPNLEEARWLYDEIYITEEGYEFHVLLEKEKELMETTIKCSDVDFK